jgi:hypothetical protein
MRTEELAIRTVRTYYTIFFTLILLPTSLCSCSPRRTVNTPSQSSLNVRPSFTYKWKTTHKITDYYTFPFSIATRETFSRGKVTRTWSSIYRQGERVELTFNFPIRLHGSYIKFTFPSTITTFRWERGWQHMLNHWYKAVAGLNLFFISSCM